MDGYQRSRLCQKGLKERTSPLPFLIRDWSLEDSRTSSVEQRHNLQPVLTFVADPEALIFGSLGQKPTSSVIEANAAPGAGSKCKQRVFESAKPASEMAKQYDRVCSFSSYPSAELCQSEQTCGTREIARPVKGVLVNLNG
jgi:hypothetical protein